MDIERDYARLLKVLASNIKQVRTRLELTQEEMADRGFNYRFYQKLESGTYSPNLFTLHRLAKAFKVKITEFLK